MAKRPAKKITTKKELSRLKREKRQRRIILVGAIIVLVIVLGIIAFGFLNEFVFEGLQKVAIVNEEKITVNDFRKEMKYQRFQYIKQYQNYYQIYQALGPEVGSSFLSNLEQIDFLLSDANAEQFGSDIVNQLVEKMLINQYAQEHGITVSEEEIDEGIQEAFGFYQNGTPTPTNTVTPFVTSTLSDVQYSLITPTPLVTPSMQPNATSEAEEPTISPTPELEATQEPTAEVIEETPLPTVEPSPTATATQYTFESFQTSFDNLMTELKNISYKESDLRDTFRAYLLRQKVLEEISKDLKPEEDQVWARHILVEDESIAQEILSRLDAGDDWTSLAAEYSTDQINKDKGGDLGWFGKGKMIAPFEEAAYQLGIGEISEPVQTDFGWHIIQVLGREVRPLTQSSFQSLREKTLMDWLEDQKASMGVEIFDNWKNEVQMVPTIPPELVLD